MRGAIAHENSKEQLQKVLHKEVDQVDQAAEPPEPLGHQSRSVAWSTGGKATALRISYMRLHIAVALRIKRFDPIASLLQPQIEIYL